MLIREILGEKEQTQRTNPNISNDGSFSYVYGLGNRSGHSLVYTDVKWEERRGYGRVRLVGAETRKCDQDNSDSRCECGYSQALMTQENMDKWLNKILCLNHDYQPIFSDDSRMRQYYRCSKCDSVNT